MQYKMEQTWRWFGPDDPVTLKDIRQTGATGIVTALHHIPFGQVWTEEEIRKRMSLIEAEGLKWSVVESVPLHEDIKTRTGNYRHYIENYKATIRHLGACNIPVVTYNFMPVNDWTRTSLNHRMKTGALALYFNWADLAVFDLYILKRKKAELSYSNDLLKKAEERYKTYSPKQLEELAGVVMFGIPGEQKNTTAAMLKNLEVYKDIDALVLKNNLCDFQKEISETALEAGVKLAIHPDDPPFPIFGLPRVVSTLEDYSFFLDKVNNEANGVCFCTGSLGASPDNDLPSMIRQLGHKIHFLHLRNVSKDVEGNFYESDHLGGDNNMAAIVTEIVHLQQATKKSIPFRPDHGHQMLDDLNKITNPGYSAIGRMRGLAEIRGLEMGILHGLK